MFLQTRLLGFIGLLSSLSLTSPQSSTGVSSNDLELGTAFMVSVTGPANGPGERITRVVVKVTTQKIYKASELQMRLAFWKCLSRLGATAGTLSPTPVSLLG